MDLNGYQLSRSFWDYAAEHPEEVKPIHAALYFYIIELCNRLGWKERFGLPTDTTKAVMGISNSKTYSNTLDKLHELGFIEIIQRSKNQHTSNIIALVKNTQAEYQHCTDTVSALYQHGTGTVSIDKPIKLIQTIETNKQEVTYYKKFAHLSLSDQEFLKLCDLGYSVAEIDNVLESIENYKKNKLYVSLYLTAKKWLERDKKTNPVSSGKGTASIINTFSQVKMRA